jgi:acyl-coenzyme A thioesterase PaaI-like protein
MSTYPPDDHVLRHLRIESWLEAPDHAFAQLPAAAAVLDGNGAVSLGALTTLVDIACARVSFASAHPHWIATADLSVVRGEPVSEGMVRAEARMVKAGSKLISIDVDLHGAGTAAASFARIPREASLVDRPPPAVGERTAMPLLLPELEVHVTERMGLRSVHGGIELDRTDYVGNSFGTINGGVLGFLVAAAAEEVTGLVAADLVLRYLGQTKVGPAHATATVVRTGTDHAVCDVRVRDAGADGMLLARATVTTIRP